MRSLLLIALALIAMKEVRPQTTISVEQYSYMGLGNASLLTPVAHYENKHNWYAEARYNYEDINTFSLYAGRTFSGHDDLSWSLTPMVGGMAGKLKGGSFGLNSACTFRKFGFSSQAQYSVSADTQNDNFFYNWSELYYQPVRWIYTGIALQHTRAYATTALLNPGILLGFSYNQWSFPLYSFNPFAVERYFVLGINWEWRAKRQQHNAVSPVLSKSD
ncbi:MAG: hypothetical protein ABIU63_14315 [Chitinophagaceae bacterium]